MKTSKARFIKLPTLLVLSLTVFSCTKDTIFDQRKIVPFLEGWKIDSNKAYIDADINKLLFITPSSGYIIGNNGKIMHTSDSGKTWQRQTSGTSSHLNSIFFLNENTGFISGRGMSGLGCIGPDCYKGSVFLKTVDGGTHWEKRLYDSLAYLESMQFRDEINGIAIMETFQRPNSEHKFLVKTMDGGLTWNKRGVDIPQGYDLEIINAENVYYLISTNQSILKSIDYGRTWATMKTPVNKSDDIYGLYFISKNIGFISDPYNTYKTFNGGATWQHLDIQPIWLLTMHFVNKNEGFFFNWVTETAHGGDGIIFKGIYIYSTGDGGYNWNRSELLKNFFPGYLSFPVPNIGYSIHSLLNYKFTKK